MKEAIWQAFRETGDPLCYLLYRASCGDLTPKSSENTPKTA